MSRRSVTDVGWRGANTADCTPSTKNTPKLSVFIEQWLHQTCTQQFLLHHVHPVKNLPLYFFIYFTILSNRQFIPANYFWTGYILQPWCSGAVWPLTLKRKQIFLTFLQPWRHKCIFTVLPRHQCHTKRFFFFRTWSRSSDISSHKLPHAQLQFIRDRLATFTFILRTVRQQCRQWLLPLDRSGEQLRTCMSKELQNRSLQLWPLH